jgi:hypothetical protein
MRQEPRAVNARTPRCRKRASRVWSRAVSHAMPESKEGAGESSGPVGVSRSCGTAMPGSVCAALLNGRSASSASTAGRYDRRFLPLPLPLATLTSSWAPGASPPRGGWYWWLVHQSSLPATASATGGQATSAIRRSKVAVDDRPSHHQIDRGASGPPPDRVVGSAVRTDPSPPSGPRSARWESPGSPVRTADPTNSVTASEWLY